MKAHYNNITEALNNIRELINIFYKRVLNLRQAKEACHAGGRCINKIINKLFYTPKLKFRFLFFDFAAFHPSILLCLRTCDPDDSHYFPQKKSVRLKQSERDINKFEEKIISYFQYFRMLNILLNTYFLSKYIFTKISSLVFRLTLIIITTRNVLKKFLKLYYTKKMDIHR